MLPVKVQSALREHLDIVRRQHNWDLSQGLGRVPLPAALARKYPNADREWSWQWVFPAPTHYFDRQAKHSLPIPFTRNDRPKSGP